MVPNAVTVDQASFDNQTSERVADENDRSLLRFPQLVAVSPSILVSLRLCAWIVQPDHARCDLPICWPPTYLPDVRHGCVFYLWTLHL